MTCLAQTPHFAPPVFLILFTILAVGAITVSLLSGNSRKAGKVMVIVAMAVGLGIVWVYFRHEQHRLVRHEALQQMEAEQALKAAAVDFPRRGVRDKKAIDRPVIERLEEARSLSPGDSGRAIAAPNDFAQWERDGVLGFQPEHDWSEQLHGSGLRSRTVGDTEFVFWPASSSERLVGFSEKELIQEDAYRAATQSASDKFAVLGLMALKERKKKIDAHAAWPLARQLASNPKMFHEESKHFETARLPKAGENVHRAAVVIRAGGEEVDALASLIGQEIERGWIARQKEVRSWFLAGGGALVAAFAIFLFYAFANAGTKGYFAWPLRLASLALFGLLCAGIYYVRLKMGLG